MSELFANVDWDGVSHVSCSDMSLADEDFDRDVRLQLQHVHARQLTVKRVAEWIHSQQQQPPPPVQPIRPKKPWPLKVESSDSMAQSTVTIDGQMPSCNAADGRDDNRRSSTSGSTKPGVADRDTHGSDSNLPQHDDDHGNSLSLSMRPRSAAKNASTIAKLESTAQPLVFGSSASHESQGGGEPQSSASSDMEMSQATRDVVGQVGKDLDAAFLDINSFLAADYKKREGL
eukprot:SAG31_NODE_1983_length_6741_cov_6.836194_6_plen_231_part_00